MRTGEPGASLVAMRRMGDSRSWQRRAPWARLGGTCVGIATTLWALAATAEPVAPPASDDEIALEQHTTLLSEPSYSSLQTAWREVQTDIQREAWLEATGRLSYLVELRTDLGLPNLPEFASVLMHAAEDAAADGATDASTALADAAAVLAPDLASPRLARARHHFAAMDVANTIRSLHPLRRTLTF